MANGTMKAKGWKIAGQTAGSNPITLPSDWSELLVQVMYSWNTITSLFTRNMMGDSVMNFSGGNYGTSYALLSISKTQGNLQNLTWAGTDKTASADVYWYYK